MDKKYCIVMLEESKGVCRGLLPDFTLSTTERSSEDCMENLKLLAQQYIDLAKKFGNKIPSPTPLTQMQAKWGGYTVETLTLKV